VGDRHLKFHEDRDNLLAKILGVDLNNPPTNSGSKTRDKAKTNWQAHSTGERAHTKEFDLAKYHTVKAALERDTGDRSADTYHLMAVCHRAGLTFAQACWAEYQSDWLTSRLDERKEDDEVDLMRCWMRAVDEEQQKDKQTEADSSQSKSAYHGIDGATFILDTPQKIPAVWGRGHEVLWAEGESLMIASGLGLGKTTLAGLLVRARLFGGDVLGWPLLATGEPILYLALDRPRQIARSMRRQFTEEQRRMLAKRLIIWDRPLEYDLTKRPEHLAELADRFGAKTVFLDSLKDAAIGLSDDEVGAAYNRARSLLIASGVELCEQHHLVKNPKGSVDDAYGSRWLTAGCGSLILLSGQPGDPFVGFRHARCPASEVGLYQLLSFHDTGDITVPSSVDLIQMARIAEGGLTAKDAAKALFDKQNPDRNDIEKARRKLNKEIEKGTLRCEEGQRGGGEERAGTVWFLA
jgi:AAA domain